MHYLIDGHNLIGRCRTIRLGDPDDEAQVIDLLHRWVLRRSRHHVTVVFDGGVYGHPVKLDRAGIRAVFAHSPHDADARLVTLISRLADPQHHRVVTSDRAIASVAAARSIAVIDSATFAAEIEQPHGRPHQGSRQRSKRLSQRPEPKVAKADVDQWLREFGVAPDDE